MTYQLDVGPGGTFHCICSYSGCIRVGVSDFGFFQTINTNHIIFRGIFFHS